jgi:parvulin-like peptidyl-prolyl isomerase
MTTADILKGAEATVQKHRSTALYTAALAIFAIFLGACGGGAGPVNNGGTTSDPNEIAARVNGKEIRMEEVDKAVKAQGGGEIANLSPLELASARMTVLNQLVQGEVMYQKAQAEQTVPTDEEVTAEMNKRKTGSSLSAEEFDSKMKEAGETEQTWRENVKKEIALQKLQEKISARVDAPKDSEIADFYNTNKEQFKNKRGAQLGAIVIDPSNSGQGDTTTNEAEANIRAKDVGQRAMSGSDFATLAREFSEDLSTRSSGGDWRYFTEDEMKQTFGANITDFIMTKMQNGQIVPTAIQLQGRVLIVKLQRKQETDEDLTLESPGVRQQVTQLLTNARQGLLWQSYAASAMNEAKIENLLAAKIVANPNELSGARPATAAPANASNTNANSNTNTESNVNADSNAAASNANSNAANATNAAAANDANGNANTNAAK